MNEKTEISLSLAKAFLEQGHENIARSIINKLLIDNGLDTEDDELIESTQG
jgi:hypothetical protein